MAIVDPVTRLLDAAALEDSLQAEAFEDMGPTAKELAEDSQALPRHGAPAAAVTATTLLRSRPLWQLQWPASERLR